MTKRNPKLCPFCDQEFNIVYSSARLLVSCRCLARGATAHTTAKLSEDETEERAIAERIAGVATAKLVAKTNLACMILGVDLAVDLPGSIDVGKLSTIEAIIACRAYAPPEPANEEPELIEAQREEPSPRHIPAQHELTILDFFASSAMQAIAAQRNGSDSIASKSYEIARAMLKERKLQDQRFESERRAKQ